MLVCSIWKLRNRSLYSWKSPLDSWDEWGVQKWRIPKIAEQEAMNCNPDYREILDIYVVESIWKSEI